MGVGIDALPNGTYVATWRDGSIECNGVAIPPPPNGAILPLYPRLRNADVAQFTGQEWQASDRALTWNALNGWAVDARVACGVSPCIYDNTNTLFVNVGCVVGSQGWRYVTADNELVTGDATYSPTASWRLWEWTQLDSDLVIGQGENGGCLVWDRGQMRYLITESVGVCRFIRAVRVGDTVSVAYWGESGVPSAAHWLTVAELRSLPLVGSTPTPEPPIPPTPNPPEVPMILTAEFVATHPARVVLGQGANEHERRENALRFCNTVARDANIQEPSTRYGLLEKTSGANAFGYAADIIFDFLSGDHFDVVGASESPDARPQFVNHGPMDRQRWRQTNPAYYVGGPVEPPVPGPEPIPPVPGQPTNADIYAAIGRLQADFDRVFRG